MKRTPSCVGGGALALAVCAAVAIGLSSCGTVPATAATVDGADITRSDFERDLRALAANPELLNITGGTEVSIDGPTARSWLRQLIFWKAAEDVLADQGLEPTQDSIDLVNSQLESNDAAKGLPQAMKDEVARGAASVESLALVPAPSTDDLQAQYAESPASTGALCARHILVETEAEAEAVLAELDGGADFAELAKERSIEPAAAESGGALTGTDGSACLPVTDVQSQFDRGFTAGALSASVDTPTQPVESEFGWHVILVRPYDEVADDLTALVSTAPGDAALAGALVAADIQVDPRYGRWEQTISDVISLR